MCKQLSSFSFKNVASKLFTYPFPIVYEQDFVLNNPQ